jgi:hypothetical protein
MVDGLREALEAPQGSALANAEDPFKNVGHCSLQIHSAVGGELAPIRHQVIPQAYG